MRSKRLTLSVLIFTGFLGLALSTGCQTCVSADVAQSIATVDSNNRTLGGVFNEVIGGRALSDKEKAHYQTLIVTNNALSARIVTWAKKKTESN